MTKAMKDKEDNVLWIGDNTDSYAGFQEIYKRVNYLEKNPKVPWILLNVCCDGSDDSDYSSAVLNLLVNCRKPIKTQVISKAHSYGLLYACVGDQRHGWPDASFMHHSFHTDLEHTSIEDMAEILKTLQESEKQTLKFMETQMGTRGFSMMMKEFKKNANKDMYFNTREAMRYNIVNGVGIIEPVLF